jgi:hypothetical protein
MLTRLQPLFFCDGGALRLAPQEYATSRCWLCAVMRGPCLCQRFTRATGIDDCRHNFDILPRHTTLDNTTEDADSSRPGCGRAHCYLVLGRRVRLRFKQLYIFTKLVGKLRQIVGGFSQRLRLCIINVGQIALACAKYVVCGSVCHAFWVSILVISKFKEQVHLWESQSHG